MSQATRSRHQNHRTTFTTLAGLLTVGMLLSACQEKVVGEPAKTGGGASVSASEPAPTPTPVGASSSAATVTSAPAVASTTAAPRTVPLAVQGVSAAGVTVRVKGIEIGVDATVLDVSISFANRITNSTMLALLDTFLEDENGTRLQIKRPADNRDLTIKEGETLNGTLVFMGAVPASARKLRLVFNESNADDNIVAPGFKVDIPLSEG